MLCSAGERVRACDARKPHHRCTHDNLAGRAPTCAGRRLLGVLHDGKDGLLLGRALAFGRRGLEQALEERHRKKSNSLRHSKQNCDYLEDAH